ncbi:hypothetical protein IE81DRAFT_35353 [Ceraceosorus guamensis]|uniref:Uncharacterized protein n=1 Tax=Ceraceosorus guamensis TaxID=1522189 RepID=A0A316VUW2_9BASI|nr:hypothetical protein IE81DRAFT_35353 [Ceraceosorus guamensis]PWN39295.1 hypothetical protein IE81DRAFT_35353 [Ceraceosorus guamensis]
MQSSLAMDAIFLWCHSRHVIPFRPRAMCWCAGLPGLPANEWQNSVSLLATGVRLFRKTRGRSRFEAMGPEKRPESNFRSACPRKVCRFATLTPPSSAALTRRPRCLSLGARDDVRGKFVCIFLALGDSLTHLIWWDFGSLNILVTDSQATATHQLARHGTGRACRSKCFES